MTTNQKVQVIIGPSVGPERPALRGSTRLQAPPAPESGGHALPRRSQPAQGHGSTAIAAIALRQGSGSPADSTVDQCVSALRSRVSLASLATALTLQRCPFSPVRALPRFAVG